GRSPMLCTPPSPTSSLDSAPPAANRPVRTACWSPATRSCEPVPDSQNRWQPEDSVLRAGCRERVLGTAVHRARAFAAPAFAARPLSTRPPAPAAAVLRSPHGDTELCEPSASADADDRGLRVLGGGGGWTGAA